MLIRTLALLALLASPVLPQSVDLTEYLPLGVFNAWKVERVGDAFTVKTARVSHVDLVQDVVHYTVALPAVGELASLDLVLGWDEELLYLYGLRADGQLLDEFSGQDIRFETPVLLGGEDTDLDVAPTFTPVRDHFVTKLKTGPVKGKTDVWVTGTVGVSWKTPQGGINAAVGSFEADDLALLVLDLALDFTPGEEPAEEPGAPTTEPPPLLPGFELQDPDGRLPGAGASSLDSEGAALPPAPRLNMSIPIVLGPELGLLQVAGVGSDQYKLLSAILPGMTVGDFPEKPPGLVSLDFCTEDLFTLHGAAASETTGGDYVLTGIQLEHLLGGKLFLRATLSEVGAEGTAGVPVELKGSCKMKGLNASLNLKGKADLPGLAKPLVMKAKAKLDWEAESLTIVYKSGKEISGSMQLEIVPDAADSVCVELNTPVDTELDPDPEGALRRLGAEGILTIGSTEFQVTLEGKVKSKAGKPSKHKYILRQTGVSTRLVKTKGKGLDIDDFELTGFSAKLLGLRYPPETLDDVFYDVE